MELRPHSNEWYDRLAQLQRGYYYPWKSTVGPGDGETAYLQLVEEHLTARSDVLDVGCGHGELTLQLARRCRSILGYDRVAEYIRLAREATGAAGITNATFIEANSAPRANAGVARVPAEANSFDLILSRRGPLSWIADAHRVGRPGAVCIQLNPAGHGPPAWNEELPPEIRLSESPADLEETVCRDLHEAGLSLHSWWKFSVPEWFDDPRELYARLTWGRDPQDMPPFEQVAGAIQAVFARHAGPRGLALRHERFLWKATVEAA